MNVPVKRKSSKPIDLAFAREVRMRRASAGMSQETLGALADISGGHQVSWVETDHGCNLSSAVQIARVLGISLDALYGLGEHRKAA